MFGESSRFVWIDRGKESVVLDPRAEADKTWLHPLVAAYEVEFMSLDGRTIGVQTLQAGRPRAVSASAVPHERVRAAA